jgi:hypothetical protein
LRPPFFVAAASAALAVAELAAHGCVLPADLDEDKCHATGGDIMIDQEQRPATQQRRPTGEAPSQLNHVDDTPTTETPVEARGGLLGRPVLLVLGASLVLAILAGILVGLIPV